MWMVRNHFKKEKLYFSLITKMQVHWNGSEVTYLGSGRICHRNVKILSITVTMGDYTGTKYKQDDDMEKQFRWIFLLHYEIYCHEFYITLETKSMKA